MLGGCSTPYIYKGTVIDPAKPAPDFTLVDQNGQPFTLSEQRGNVVLLFFGFTTCPDVCPTTLADLASARERLGENANRLKVALITVDPERDTPEKLGPYVSRHDPNFLGLTGTSAELEQVRKSYGAYAIKRELENSQLGYTIDHSSYIYIIDPQGNWREIFPYGSLPEDIASDVRELIRSGGRT